VRGPGGGYCLARPIANITVADIIAAVDEPIDATQCGGKENCLDDRRCVTHDLWATLNEKMNDYLSSVSLADVVAHQQGKSVQVIKDFRGRDAPAQGAAERPAWWRSNPGKWAASAAPSSGGHLLRRSTGAWRRR
jgi:Rrf2 family iron-sulfur cluster assembly transcriptional regulator